MDDAFCDEITALIDGYLNLGSKNQAFGLNLFLKARANK